MSDRSAPKTVTMPLAGGFRFGDWTVVPAENLLRRGDRKVRLEPKVMRLLLSLVARHDQVCTRDQLLDELWPSPETTETSLTRALSDLRRALGDTRGKGAYIETIQRVGYKAVAPLAPLPTRLPRVPTDPFGQPLDSAQELVALADYLIARRNPVDLAQAIAALSHFAEAEPVHAQVFAMLAYAERLLPLYREEPGGLRTAQARAHANEALRLDGANGLAWAVLGGLAHDQWQWREALQQFERAVAHAPHDAYVLHDYSELLLHLGAIDRALKCIERACRIKRVSAGERLVLAWMLLHRDAARAGLELAFARRLGADTVFADNLECLLKNRSGWTESGLARWRELDRLRRDDPLWMWPACVMEVVAGDAPAAGLADAAADRVETGRLDPGVAFFLLASFGPEDAAGDMAVKAIETRRFFVIDPWLDETQRFRDLPAFASLERRLGLTGMADEARD
ncbi:MAG TPA: winged helix-turn-helix domain-containing protein [Wenzhouxiangellaceae bacterium]|nr:winged helix-turn-helix domain-containing protein [Wenzhouxiangellaceae bacterium]HKL53388.1 winged helix-turn-helix domain-containing protein [Wenzhouxiangellaceae bacterium]